MTARSIALAALLAAPAGAAPFIRTFHGINTVSSTVPHEGDVNPYGVAVVLRSVGEQRPGGIVESRRERATKGPGWGAREDLGCSSFLVLVPHARVGRSRIAVFSAENQNVRITAGIGEVRSGMIEKVVTAHRVRNRMTAGGAIEASH